MNADLHHQLHTHFDRLANDLEPATPDHFNPTRPTTLTDRHPSRRRPLLAIAAAITLIAGTTLLLTQRNPPDPSDIPGPDTTETSPATTNPDTSTTAPTDVTSTSPTSTPSTTPDDVGSVPSALQVALRPPVGTAATVWLLPDGESVLVATTPNEYSVDENGAVATGSDSGEFSARVLDISTGDIVHEFPWATGPHIFSDDGSRYFDGQRLWDLATGGEIGDRVGITGFGFASQGASTTFSSDGSLLVLALPYRVGSFDLVLIDTTDGSTLWRASSAITFTSGASPPVRFSDDGANVYLGDQIHDLASGDRLDGTAPPERKPADGFWNPDLVNSLNGRPEECLLYSAWSSGICGITTDGSRLAMISPSGDSVEIWEIDQFSSLPADRGIAPDYVFEVADAIGPARFLPDGESILVGDPNGKTEYVYDIETGGVLREFPGGEVFAPKLVDPTGRRYFDGRRLLNLEKDEMIGKWESLYAAGFSPDGTTLAIASRDGALSMIDAADGSTRWRRQIGSLNGAFLLVQFSDDGSAIFVDGEVLDAATGDQRLDLASLAPNRPTAGFWDPSLVEALDTPYDSCDEDDFFCDITSDGSRIAMFHDGVVKIWEIVL